MNKILIVDDDVDILTMVKMSLGMNGFMVEAISRWQEFDDRIKVFAPDLVLLDVSLGDADGRDLCRNLKATRNTAGIPVILFSANAGMGASVHECGAQAFIEKPYNLQHMLTTIRTLIDRKELLQTTG